MKAKEVNYYFKNFIELFKYTADAAKYLGYSTRTCPLVFIQSISLISPFPQLNTADFCKFARRIHQKLCAVCK